MDATKKPTFNMAARIILVAEEDTMPVDYEEVGAELARMFVEGEGAFPTINGQLAQHWGIRPPAALFRVKQAVKHGYVAYYQNGAEKGHYHPTAKALAAAAKLGWVRLGAGRPTPIVAVYSEAGGVGKSTLAREIAVATARAGLRVLVVDTDTQGTLSRWLLPGLEPEEGDTILPIFTGKPLPEPRVSKFGPHVIPANRELGELERLVRTALGGTAALKMALQKQVDEYDLIVIDTRGGEGAAVNAALTASNLLLVPVQTSLKGLQGLPMVLEYVAQQAALHDLEDTFLGVVPFMYRPRGTADSSIYEALKAVLAEEGTGRLFSPVHMRPGVFRNAEMNGPLSFEGPTEGDLHFTVAQILTEVAQRRNLLGGALRG